MRTLDRDEHQRQKEGAAVMGSFITAVLRPSYLD
jgi:hypothetical protein